MEVKTFTFNPFYENTFVIYDDSNECVIIDAGCYSEEEQNQLTDFLTENQLKPKYLLNTHCHVDHILGNKYLKSKYDIEFCANQQDVFLLNNAVEHGKMFGFELEQPPKIDKEINEGDIIRFGNSQFDVICVPGHTPGHVAFYSHEDEFVVVGDVLFKGSIGRTDLEGGDYDILMKSIKEKLLTLDDETLVYSGHGGNTTIGIELKNNPFLIE